MGRQKEMRFGPYRLLERLGTGGMAEVFRARLDGRGRDVAIKRLLPQFSDDADLISMFTDEARLSRQLSHRGIARVYESGTIDGSLYIAMEHVAGKDLAAVARAFDGRPMPVGMAVAIAVAVADALGHAHALCDKHGQPLNVVHRDVSPQNILVSFGGQTKLIDFGIAKARVRLQHTMGGVIKGKFAYMSPEQIQGGGKLDGRADLFALGIVLFEMLAARPLFGADNDLQTITNILEAKVPSLREANPAVPRPLQQVIERTLAREAGERYPAAPELRAALVAAVSRSREQVMSAEQLGQWMRRAFADEARRALSVAAERLPANLDDTLQDDFGGWTDVAETEPDPADARRPPSEEVATALLQRPPPREPDGTDLPTLGYERPSLSSSDVVPIGGAADPFAGEETKTSSLATGVTDTTHRPPSSAAATLFWVVIGVLVCVGSGVIAYYWGR